MGTGNKISTAVLMWFIALVAIELAAFHGVWFIILAPPITMAVLTINLGVFFLMVRPKLLEARIIGMMLGGLVACFATVLGVIPEPLGMFDHLQNVLYTGASSLPDPQGVIARSLRSLGRNFYIFYFAVLDVLGVAIIWAGGWLGNRWRRRRVHTRATVASTLAPP
jgi:hypothetical protein